MAENINKNTTVFSTTADSAAQHSNPHANAAEHQTAEYTETHNSAAAKDHRYEALYTELLDRGDQLHEANKRRIRRGIVILIILPVILDAIRLVTDSDKVVFLIIWILIMFAMSAYLISIEYLDSAIEKTLQDVTDTEADFDGLLPKPELPVGDLHERIRERLDAIRPDKPAAEEEPEDEEAAYIEEVIDHLEQTMDEVTAIAADAIALTHMDEVETEAEELKEAEDAMEELRETAPAEIIAAMKEAFDRDMTRKNSQAVEKAEAKEDAE